MTQKAADDFEAIRRRLEELEAEKQVALTGTSAPTEQPQPVESVYGIEWSGWRKDYGLASLAHPEWPYAGTAHEWRGFVNHSEYTPVTLRAYAVKT